MKLSIRKCFPDNSDKYEEIKKINLIYSTLSSTSNRNFYLSWGWIKNWLHSLPVGTDLWLVTLYDNDKIACLYFLGENKLIRHKLFKSNSINLNTTGVGLFDSIYIEYNSILCSSVNSAYLKTSLEQLPLNWDELKMPAMDAGAFSEMVENLKGFRVIIDKDAPSYFVDLKTVTESKEGYISLLSSNTRSKIRRSYRGYKVFGEIVLEEAKNSNDAEDIFEEMVRLHQNCWQNRGHRGCFSSSFFLDFHRNLVRDRFDFGEIQLLRVSAGSETIACLYNYVYRKKVLFYLSGIKYEDDPRLKPGLIAHVEAIEHNAKMGNHDYDFLAGESQYKRSLSTDQRRMIWARIQKPRAKFLIEETLRKIKRRYKKVLN